MGCAFDRGDSIGNAIRTYQEDGKMRRFALLAVLLVAWGLAGAQDKIYRCGNEYVNEVPADALAAGRCKLLEGAKGVASEKKPSKNQRKPTTPVEQSGIVVTNENPDDYVGDRWIKPVATATPEPAKPLGNQANKIAITKPAPLQREYTMDDLSREGLRYIPEPTPEVAPASKMSVTQTPTQSRDALSGNRSQSATDQPAIPGRDVVGSIVFFGLLAFGLTGYFWMRSVGKSTSSPSTSPPDDRSFGIHGWLRFFVISLGILGPALSLGRAAGNFRGDEMVYAALASVPAWATYKTVVWLTLALFSAFSIYAALKLRFVWKPASVMLAKIAVVSWPVCSLAVGVVIPMAILGDEELSLDPKFVGSFLALIISTVVWFVYLSRSKRVRATYSGELVGTQPVAREASELSSAGEQAQQVNSINPQTRAVPVESTPRMETENELSEWGGDQPFDEEAIYETIAAELESGATDKGLWTRVFAECEGDEKRTRVLYIKQRAEKLKVIESVRREQVAAQQAELRRLEAIENGKAEELGRRNAALGDVELTDAVWNGKLSTAIRLLGEGVSPFGSDANGVSLLDLARTRGDQQMVDLLSSYGAGNPEHASKANE